MVSKPTCWSCGYDLSGVRVDAECPECGTPIWSRPEPAAVNSTGQTAFVLGIVALIIFCGAFFTCACASPIGGAVGIPAVILGRRGLEDVRTGRASRDKASMAKASLICGWIAIGLSITLIGALAIYMAGSMIL